MPASYFPSGPSSTSDLPTAIAGAKDTADIARALGLTLLFTPVRSPESNGISESFVKTLKRDYARLNILHDADAILAMLPDWIEDYCEIHPHSGLKF